LYDIILDQINRNLENENTVSLGDESLDIPPPSLPVEQPAGILIIVTLHHQAGNYLIQAFYL
jgi:hypothetical protein